MNQPFLVLCLFISSLLSSFYTNACTRISHQGDNGLIITGRSMDWPEDLPLRIWKYPRGIERHGAAGERSLEWVSRFGSVVVTAYDAGAAEGMNEAGLSVHLMWLQDTDYGFSDSKPALSVGAWAQFVLDNYGSTQEAVIDLEQKNIQIISPPLPTGVSPKAYLAMTDRSGHTAVIEYHAGQQVIYSSDVGAVMTNLSHEETKVLDVQFRDGAYHLDALPGSYLSSARYQRATYYLEMMTGIEGAEEVLPIVTSILETVTMPRYPANKKQPYLSKTIYRTLMDQTNRVFYYQNINPPFYLSVSFERLDFGGEPRILSYNGDGTTSLPSGECSALFKSETPFMFISAGHL